MPPTLTKMSMASEDRLKVVARHLMGSCKARGNLSFNETAGSKTHFQKPQEIKSAIPKNRTELLKWNGWGYNDSKFCVNTKNIIEFTGSRYPIGQQELPYFTEWVQEKLNVQLDKRNVPRDLPKDFPPSSVTQGDERLGHGSLSGGERISAV